jgi:hypothetical protein
MQTHLARICVLYMDLLLEVSAAMDANRLTVLDDYADGNSRRMYFVRMALGTVWEIKQSCDVLNKNRAFNGAKLRMHERNRRLWDAAIGFFQANQDRLKVWRNEIGGKFGDDAAKFAIDHVDPSLTDRLIVVSTDDNKNTALMPFAYQLVAVGMSKSRSPDTDYPTYFEAAFNLAMKANEQAIAVGNVLAAEFLVH